MQGQVKIFKHREDHRISWLQRCLFPMKRTTHSIRWKGSQPLLELNGLHCMFKGPYSLLRLTLESYMGHEYGQDPPWTVQALCGRHILLNKTYRVAEIGRLPFYLSKQRYLKAFLKLGLHLGKTEIWFWRMRGEAARMTWCTPCMGHLLWFP